MAPAFASADFHAHDFFRALDWRLVAARQLVAGKRSRRRRHTIDPVVARLTSVLKTEAGRSKSHKTLATDADLAAWRQAVQLRDAGGLLKDEVEARLLAGQTDEEIAARCRLSPAAVGWYEAGLFHVRDHLDSPDWVVARVIGTTFPTGDDGPVLKHFAYLGGPTVLDLVLAVVLGRPLPTAVTATFGRARSYREHRLRFLVQFNVSILRATTAAECVRLIDEYERARRIDRLRTDVPPALNSDLRSCRAVLGLAAGRSKAKAKAAVTPPPAATGSAGTNPPSPAPRKVPTPVAAGR